MNVFATAASIIIEHGFGTAPVRVEVLDALGRTVIDRDNIRISGRISLPTEELSTGVWFVRVNRGDAQRTFRVPLVH